METVDVARRVASLAASIDRAATTFE